MNATKLFNLLKQFHVYESKKKNEINPTRKIIILYQFHVHVNFQYENFPVVLADENVPNTNF